MNRQVLQKIKQKNALSRKVVATKDPVIKQEYNKVRNQVKSMTNKLKKQFEKDLSKNSRTNPKAIWQYIKTKSKTKIGIGEIHVNPQDPTSKKLIVIKRKRRSLLITLVVCLQENQRLVFQFYQTGT